jgi:hypothetical protein
MSRLLLGERAVDRHSVGALVRGLVVVVEVEAVCRLGTERPPGLVLVHWLGRP